MVDWPAAVILGVIQALTEFIPVSSSGHLVIWDTIWPTTENLLALVVLVNIGTLGAIIYHYKKDLWEILSFKSPQLFGQIFLATLPAGLIGWFWADWLVGLWQLIPLVALALILLGGLMIYFGQAKKTASTERKKLTWPRALIIGLAQSLALIPGTSRSGVSILAGLRLGLDSYQTARFSFLLACPVIAGAILRVALSPEGQLFIEDNLVGLWLLNLAIFGLSLVIIKWLLAVLNRYGLKPFGYYRLFLGIFLLFLVSTNAL